MGVRSRLLVAVLLLLGVGLLAARQLYAEQKVRRLDPTALKGQVDWAGSGRRLLLVGDSRVAQWPLRPRDGWRVGRLGFSGATAPNIARAAEPVLRGERPDVVLVLAGTNDVTAATTQGGDDRGATLNEALRAVLATGSAARRSGAGQVLVVPPPAPIRTEWWKRLLLGGEQERLAERFAADVSEAARAADLDVVDATSVVTSRATFRRDSLHWTPAAYEALDRLVWRAIDERP